MMKSILFSLFFLGLTGSALAAGIPAGFTKVPEARIEDYKKSIRAAIAQNPKIMSACNQNWVNYTIDYTNEVLVNSNEGQPLLMFNNYFNLYGKDEMHRLVVTTNEDLKTLRRLEAQTFIKGETNSGDLANPVIVEDYILQTNLNCSPGDM